jgi:predicted component of type VI protein secretion system
LTATLIDQSENSDHAQHLVKYAFVRVGCNDDSDIRIGADELPDIQVTLEFRDGAYWLHNGCPMAIAIDGRRLAAGSSGSLRHGSLVTLADDISFALDIDDDPSPTSTDEDDTHLGQRLADGIADESSSADDAPLSSEVDEIPAPVSTIDGKVVAQLGMIALLLVVLIGMVVYKIKETQAPAVAAPTIKLYDLVSLPAQNEDRKQRILEQLQRAELFYWRTDLIAAREIWLRLRDEIDWPSPRESLDQPQSDENYFEVAALSLIKSRITYTTQAKSTGS